MTSKIKVNILADGGDNAIITSDGAGSFTASSGLASSVQSVGGIQMTPAFEARLSASQSIGDAVDAKVQYNNEIFDTDNCYDNATNYRFTPTTAGKYFVYGYAYLDSQAGSNFDQGRLYIFKNGSNYTQCANNMGGNFPEAMTIHVQSIIDFNGTTDYVEIYAKINSVANADCFIRQESSGLGSYFGAYKIIE